VRDTISFTPGFQTLYPREGRYDERRFIPWVFLDPIYEAVQATEEAVINALIANEEMVGIHGHRTPALPRDRVVDLLRARGVTIEPCSDRT
jgi:D-aminopeptidase